VSCKKSSLEDSSDTTSLIKIREYATNIALPTVNIKMYTCSNYDFEFGCQSTSLFVVRVTDKNGEYMISKRELNKANQGMIFSKSQYWDREGRTGENFMEPEAWAKITLKRIIRYPDSSFFAVSTTSELGLQSYLEFKAPRKDSVFYFRLFGSEINQISWMVFTKPAIYYLCCPTDSLAGGNLSLSPKKFETLAASIDY